MAGVAFAVEGDGVGFATESYAASALYTTLASLSGALWRIRWVSAFVSGVDRRGSIKFLENVNSITSVPTIRWHGAAFLTESFNLGKLFLNGRTHRAHSRVTSIFKPEIALCSLNRMILTAMICTRSGGARNIAAPKRSGSGSSNSSKSTEAQNTAASNS